MRSDDRLPGVFSDLQPVEPTALIRYMAKGELSVIWHYESVRALVPPLSHPGRFAPAGIDGGRRADRGL